MSPSLVPRRETLSPGQQVLWPALRPLADLGFALYGGTAIALRLGHRPSVDFDFFTNQPLDKPVLFATLPFLARSTVLQDGPDTLSVVSSVEVTGTQPVNVSFFGGIAFGRVGTPDVTDDGVLQVASLEDLMATKVKVILQRVEAKDYQDIAALIRAGVDLPHGLAAAQLLYGMAFQPSESLKAMVYFEGGDLDRLTDDDKRTLEAAVIGVDVLPSVTILDRRLTLPRAENDLDISR